MEKIVFAGGRIALNFGNQKINLHKFKNELDELEPKANSPTSGSEDLCLITEIDLEDAISHVKNQGIKIIEGSVKRSGAMGSILSFYFRDPDGNLIEISNYT